MEDGACVTVAFAGETMSREGLEQHHPGQLKNLDVHMATNGPMEDLPRCRP